MKKSEKRKCYRFSIPGATINYRKKRLLIKKKELDENSCPILNMSLGGISFLSQKALNITAEVTLELVLPDRQEDSITIKGIVRHSALSLGKSYKYMHGVSFLPYGQNLNENDDSLLEELKKLEEKYTE